MSSFRCTGVATALTALFIAVSASAFSAETTFAWIRGSNLKGEPGVYGTKGVAAPTNTPGARYGQNNWKDSTGVFWMFGGSGHDATDTKGSLSDMWKFDPAVGNWTWVAGPDTANMEAVYGTKGVPAASNLPGPRGGSVTWTDAAGKLWMFGGLGEGRTSFGYLDDVWCFDPASGLWTWMAGSDDPVAEPVGVGQPASPANTPGGLVSTSYWKDAAGAVWVYGGYAGLAYPDRLWRFDPATTMWTHISGNTEDANPVFGSQGSESPTNNPGARSGAAFWKDDTGCFRLFGGTTAAGVRNDMWRYNPATACWSWMGGSQEAKNVGRYEHLGIMNGDWPAATANVACTADEHGNLYMFGGLSQSHLWTYNVAH